MWTALQDRYVRNGSQQSQSAAAAAAQPSNNRLTSLLARFMRNKNGSGNGSSNDASDSE